MTRRQFATGLGLAALVAVPFGCSAKGKGGKQAPQVNVDQTPKQDEKQPPPTGDAAGADAGG